MPTYATRTHRLTIERLKGVQGLDEISFEDKPLTGIFGPNGVGKSTVLHALASAYRTPRGTESNYRQFFPPLAADVWNRTRFVIDHTFLSGQSKVQGTVEYRKGTVTTDWTPVLADRPLRHMAYIGVKSCLPDLEAYDAHDLSRAVATPLADEVDVRVREAAGRILNCQYASMANLEISGEPEKKYTSLTRQDLGGLEYASVVMGAGEQRLFKILYSVERCENDGLILIDELDLLLHGDALNRLITYLAARCRSKRLQLVFTSHREELLSLKDQINIRHLCRQTSKHFCYANSDPDSLHRLTGERERPLEIFVEDDLAEAVITQVAGELGMTRYIQFVRFGAAVNCFAVLAGLLLKGDACDHSLFVLDGDVYLDAAERQQRIDSACSGNDGRAVAVRNSMQNKITDLTLPAGVKPEPFLHRLIISQNSATLTPAELEIQAVASGIVNSEDTHSFIDDVASTLSSNRAAQLSRIIPFAAKHSNWTNYTQPVRDWLTNKKAELSLP